MGLQSFIVPDLPLPGAGSGAGNSGEEDGNWQAGKLAIPSPSFSCDLCCAEVYEQFRRSDDLAAAAVVEADGTVVGLVNRLRFLARYAQRYVPELYGRRSVLSLANPDPVLVDEDMPISELAAMLTFDHPEALRECFVVTRAGRYVGIGTGEALMRAKVALLTIREKQLHRALGAAQEANRSKSAFLALMSHELRTPLNAIIGFSEILSQELFGPVGVPRYVEYAGDIHAAGKHLLSLINDILDLSKAEAGKMELSPEPVELADFCDHCLLFVSERARTHEVRLTSHVPECFPHLNADRLRLKQIVLNLLTNAVKFTMPGGTVSLTVKLTEAGGIQLSVRDTGIGMAPESIPLALEPFRQIASPLSRKVEGTGLGLSLVKTLTELHGGRLYIESAVNKGTLVQVSFPPERTLSMPGGCRRTDGT